MRSQLIEAMHSAVDATVQSINDASPVGAGDDDDDDDFSDLEPVSMSNLFMDPHALVSEVMSAITPAASPAGKHSSDGASAKHAAAISLAGPGQQDAPGGGRDEGDLHMEPLAAIQPDDPNAVRSKKKKKKIMASCAEPRLGPACALCQLLHACALHLPPSSLAVDFHFTVKGFCGKHKASLSEGEGLGFDKASVVVELAPAPMPPPTLCGLLPAGCLRLIETSIPIAQSQWGVKVFLGRM